MIDILPCPFCGCEVKYPVQDASDTPLVGHPMNECPLTGSYFHLSEWNTRSEPAPAKVDDDGWIPASQPPEDGRAVIVQAKNVETGEIGVSISFEYHDGEWWVLPRLARVGSSFYQYGYPPASRLKFVLPEARRD